MFNVPRVNNFLYLKIRCSSFVIHKYSYSAFFSRKQIKWANWCEGPNIIIFKNPFTHQALSKVPRSFPKTSFSIFQRNRWLYSPFLCKHLQKLILLDYQRIINLFWSQSLFLYMSVLPCSPVGKVVSSACIWASIHWLTARLDLMPVQPMQKPVAGRDFPPRSPIPSLPSTSVSMVKDLDKSWRIHFQ